MYIRRAGKIYLSIFFNGFYHWGEKRILSNGVNSYVGLKVWSESRATFQPYFPFTFLYRSRRVYVSYMIHEDNDDPVGDWIII